MNYLKFVEVIPVKFSWYESPIQFVRRLFNWNPAADKWGIMIVNNKPAYVPMWTPFWK